MSIAFHALKGLHKNSTTGQPGVSRRTDVKGNVRYSVTVSKKGHQTFHKSYKTLEEAARVARLKRLEFHASGRVINERDCYPNPEKSLSSQHKRWHVSRGQFSKYCPLCQRPTPKETEETDAEVLAQVAY
jgi:hypothetical protein